LRKGPRCNQALLAWYQSVAEHEHFLSVLVVGEIRNGIERIRQRDEASAAALDSLLAGLELTFSEKILPVTRPIADRWGASVLSDRFQLWTRCWQPRRLSMTSYWSRGMSAM
jgi:predicted nucleic acid-binding protein